MKHGRLRERFARIRDARSRRLRDPIIEADTREQADAIIAARVGDGSLEETDSVLIVPATAPDLATWEARVRSGYYRAADHQGAESPSTEHAHGPNAPTDTPDVHP